MTSTLEKGKGPSTELAKPVDKTTNLEWKEFDLYEEQNLGELSSELSQKPSNQQKNVKTNAKKKQKKYTQIEQY